jgi:FtsZ-binding cell division protein ZapB
MTEKYNENNPRFRDEFGAVNDLLTGESYLCGNSAGIGERDAIDTSIELCNLLNSLYNENEQLKQENKELKKENQHIKNTIKEAYNNERTQLGKSVLKQLIQNIGDINE